MFFSNFLISFPKASHDSHRARCTPAAAKFEARFGGFVRPQNQTEKGAKFAINARAFVAGETHAQRAIYTLNNATKKP
jgi:hypothetical protein